MLSGRFLEYDIHKKIRAYGKNLAVQGELIAPFYPR